MDEPCNAGSVELPRFGNAREAKRASCHRSQIYGQETGYLCKETEIAGVMLFSRGHNMICCLAVAPEYYRRGVASMLMDEALANLDKTKEISVSTFRADDEKALAPRALYEKYGFIADALIEELNYPNPKYVLQNQNEKIDSLLSTLSSAAYRNGGSIF